MRKIEKIQIIKNVGSSWFALGVNILVGVFLSPFILHRLGDAEYMGVSNRGKLQDIRRGRGQVGF